MSGAAGRFLYGQRCKITKTMLKYFLSAYLSEASRDSGVGTRNTKVGDTILEEKEEFHGGRTRNTIKKPCQAWGEGHGSLTHCCERPHNISDTIEDL